LGLPMIFQAAWAALKPDQVRSRIIFFQIPQRWRESEAYKIDRFGRSVLHLNQQLAALTS
jgi:hypothetical protein